MPTVTWARAGLTYTAVKAFDAPGWDPGLHPRDRRGRFIETGATVRLWGGGSGTVVRNAGNGRVEVERDNGQRTVVHRNYITVTAAPDGVEDLRDRLAPSRGVDAIPHEGGSGHEPVYDQLGFPQRDAVRNPLYGDLSREEMKAHLSRLKNPDGKHPMYITDEEAQEYLPTTTVNLRELVHTQEWVRPIRPDAPTREGASEPVVLTTPEGRRYLLNGHHRVLAALSRGETSMRVREYTRERDVPSITSPRRGGPGSPHPEAAPPDEPRPSSSVGAPAEGEPLTVQGRVVRPGMRFAHARQIVGSPAAGTARPDVNTVTSVRRGRVYYRNESGYRSYSDRDRFAQVVGSWVDKNPPELRQPGTGTPPLAPEPGPSSPPSPEFAVAGRYTAADVTGNVARLRIGAAFRSRPTSSTGEAK